MQTEVKTIAKIYDFLEQNKDKRIILLQGGARSGKTYNILIYLIVLLLKEQAVLDIIRATLPALRATVLQDLIVILEDLKLFDETKHKQQEKLIKLLNNSKIFYYSVDSEQKIRGRQRDYAFLNEANEITYNKVMQILLRTKKQVILDFNPSFSQEHFIYTKLATRKDAALLITTYKDNKFLDVEIAKEIEQLKNTDNDLYRVFGLGLQAEIKNKIFNYTIIEQFPENFYCAYGLDFGFSNDPAACVKIAINKDKKEIYCEEIFYLRNLTNADICIKFAEADIKQNYDEIFADSAEPKSIEEIFREGYNIKATKNKNLNFGIQKLKQYSIFVSAKSVNLIKELNNYKYIEDKEGNATNKPIDAFNHAIDAMRYAVVSKTDNNIIFKKIINSKRDTRI